MSQPNEISSSLSAFGGGIAEIFTNVGNVVQSVGSVYDQITGKSQNVPGQAVQPTAPSPLIVASTPAKSSETNLLNSGSTLAIGAVVLIGVLLLIKD